MLSNNSTVDADVSKDERFGGAVRVCSSRPLAPGKISKEKKKVFVLIRITGEQRCNVHSVVLQGVQAKYI